MKNKKLISNLISLILVFGLVVVYLYTYHQLQASHGIGLYYAIKMNLTDKRLYFDFAADLVRFILLAGLVLIPCAFTKHLATAYLLRRLSIIVALAPTISIGCFISLFKEMHFGVDVDLYQALLSYVNVFKFILPLLIIFTLAAYKADDNFKFKAYMPFVIIAGASFVLSLSANKFFEPCVYLTFYMFILMITIIHENHLRKDSSFSCFDIFYLYLYCSALYRLIDIAIHTNF